MSQREVIRRRDIRLAAGIVVLVAVTLLATHVRGTGEPAAPSRVTAGRIVRLDPRLDRLIPDGAVLEQIASGFSWVEGPVWDRSRGSLLFSDVPNNSVFEWRDGTGVRLAVHPSGYTGTAPFAGRQPGSNGLAFDSEGRLVLAEHGDRRIARLEADGRKTTLVDRYDGKRLNSPNDLVFSSTGALYFTDPPFGLPKAFEDSARELPWSGVYRLSPDGQLELLTRDLRAPNGIALAPSEKTLYVSNADRAHAVWMAYDLDGSGRLAKGRVFFDATPWTRTRKGVPDGMKVDQEGHLFAAGPGGVHVFAPDGARLGSIELDAPTSNLGWGGDGSTLYVTTGTAVYRITLTTKGLGF